MLLVEKLLGTSSAVAANYIEDVFSTYLYTGTGATQLISNSIQLGGGTTSGWITTLATGYGNEIATDSSGNTYVCGTSGSNIQIIKFNSSGSVEWQRSLASVASEEGTSIAVDSSGNVYICGYSATSGNNNIILAKYNTSGTIQWQRSLGGSASEFGFSIAVDSSSNVYICGSSNTSGSASLLVAKYDTSGTIQWQRTLSSSFDEYGYSIAVDSSGNVYVGGIYFVSGVTPNFLLVKYNTSGTIQWQRILDGIKFIDPAIAVDSAGNVFGCATENSSDDIQIVKYDTSGTLQWQRRLGSGSTERGYSVAVDSAGNAYVCGQSNTSGNNDVVVAKYNTSGTLQWQRSLASTSNDIGYSIAIDATGSLYVTGSSGSNFLAAKLPTDGTGIGQYTIGAATFTYGVTSFADNSTTNTGATSTLTAATASFTDAASSLTDATTSLTVSTGTVPGPGKGGMVWMKGRSGATDHALYDTIRGATFDLASNLTTGQTTQATGLTAFTSSGFSIGALAKLNTSAATYASWTFRKQAKFFDIVTYTGTGVNRTVAHNLGSVPGCIITKRTDTTGNWITYHRSLGNTDFVNLNTTAATSADSGAWNNTTPTSTEFSLGTGNTNVNGGTYVAYLFAHDAGGFGAAGTDNVISCGSFTTDGSGNATVTLGHEPQWCMFKRAVGGTGNWTILDNMRGWPVGGNDSQLIANSSGAEASASNLSDPNATGFSVAGISATSTYIYIAIRRGPMKTPTSGTSVFSPIARTATGANATISSLSFPSDMSMFRLRSRATYGGGTFDRLRGATSYIDTYNTNAEAADATTLTSFASNVGFSIGTDSYVQVANAFSGDTGIIWNFGRAPGFFDVVCYTGTGSARTVSHNLGVAPEMMIVKDRVSVTNWFVYSAATGATKYLNLNGTAAAATATSAWNDTTPTSSVFTVGTSGSTNSAADTFVAYLFATVAGVSKVGSYTGTGTTKQIDCGFTGGARFVMIKRTDSTGDWYVWDTARGIVAGNDSYLLLNSTAAEVTNTDYVDTYSAGFEISSTAPAAINANGGSFIFFAVA